jgi:hypothetical protein
VVHETNVTLPVSHQRKSWRWNNSAVKYPGGVVRSEKRLRKAKALLELLGPAESLAVFSELAHEEAERKEVA